MRRACLVQGVVLAALAAAPHAHAQTLAERVSAVGDGTVRMTYAARPDACGDGGDVLALGALITVHGTMQGHGWSNASCRFGPAHVVVTRRDRETTSIRVHIGAPRSSASDATDVGAVSAREAAAYFLGLVPSLTGRAASSAIAAAAVADSVEIWRQLLDLARSDALPNDVRSSALYWMSGVATADAVQPLRDFAQSGNGSRSVREGALMALAHLRDAAGVPTLIAMTRRADTDQWMRERAIFWLGNTADDRARTTLRALASTDTLARDLREQAIFALGFLDRGGDNGAFLRTLYGRLDDRRLKDKIIQSVAQLDEPADQRWLVDRVLDTRESVELRKQALFWRGQKNDSPLGDLLALYPRLDSRELRDHYVFVLSQRRESAALDRLIDLARNDSDREIRAKATFWLGQSRDPRAMKYLEDRISK